MTFDSPALERLRALRAADGSTRRVGEVQDGRVPTLPAPAGALTTSPQTRMAVRSASRGHCGTCRHFEVAPEEGRYMGVCRMGWQAHYPWQENVRRPVIMHEGSICMTEGERHWALRPGLRLAAPPEEDGPE